MSEERTSGGATQLRPVVVISLVERATNAVEFVRDWGPIWLRHGPFAVVPAIRPRHFRTGPERRFHHLIALAPMGHDMEAFANALDELPRVMRARVRYPVRAPGVVLPLDDDHFDVQRHLRGEVEQGWPCDPGPWRTLLGTDARFAWRFPGGDGHLAAFADVERGWWLEHPDLIDPDTTDADDLSVTGPLVGEVFGPSEKHGTAALGVVCARDNARGHVGIAPNVRPVMVASTAVSTAVLTTEVRAFLESIAEELGYGDQLDYLFELMALEVTHENTADALDAVLAEMTAGDPDELDENDPPIPRAAVVLLETQTRLSVDGPYLPSEVHEDVLLAIQRLTAANITVVAAAGNGGTSIDPHMLLDAGGQIRDSGSILVGSVSPGAPHPRTTASNHGTRVDCWAWGDSVKTSWFNESGTVRDPASGNFTGTSAASAIVAGVAVVVQSLHKARTGVALSPGDLRALLQATDPPDPIEVGSPCGFDVPEYDSDGSTSPEPRERLPNLRHIIETKLLLPYSWVPSDENDSGEPLDVPATDDRSLGTTRAILSTPLGARPRDAFALTRLVANVKNRGAGIEENLQVALFSGPLSTRAAPWTWQAHGVATAAAIAPGATVDVVRTVPPRVGARFRTLAAVVGIAGRAPMRADDLSEPQTLEWMHRHMRAVSVRNVGIARRPRAVRAVDPDRHVSLPFQVVGHATDETSALLRLEFPTIRRPPGASLVGNPWVVRTLVGRIDRMSSLGDPPTARASLDGPLEPMRLTARSIAPLSIVLDMGRVEPAAGDVALTVIHVEDDEEVGRIVFRWQE